MDMDMGMGLPPAGEDVSATERIREIEAVLGRRMEHLERENERLRRRGIVLWLVIASAVGLSIATLLLVAARGRPERVAEAVQAHRFVLRSPADVERGIWEMDDDGAVRLVLRDDAGRERMRLMLLADGSPGVTLSDDRGRTRVVLGYLPDGATNLAMADASGRTRAVLGLSARGEGSLLMTDREGTTRALLALDPSGAPDFTLYRPAAAANESSQPADTTGADTTGAARDTVNGR